MASLTKWDFGWDQKYTSSWQLVERWGKVPTGGTLFAGPWVGGSMPLPFERKWSWKPLWLKHREDRRKLLENNLVFFLTCWLLVCGLHLLAFNFTSSTFHSHLWSVPDSSSRCYKEITFIFSFYFIYLIN